MEISILLMEQIAELFLMILMGYIIVKTGLLKGEDSKVISKIVLYLVIPCVIINAFQVDYTSEKVKELLLVFAASVLLQVILLAAVWGAGTPCMIFASLQYVTNAPFRTADDPSVSVISEAICPDVADSIVVIVRFFSIRSFVSFL